jgi:phosphate-selective porin OprO/OprP
MHIALLTLITVASVLAASPVLAVSQQNFDRAWRLPTLYDNEDNRVLQKFALSGRLQTDSAYFDADQGDYDDNRWRRFRFGFKANLYQDWVLHLEGEFELHNDLGNSYSRLTDAYIGWFPDKAFSLKLLKQSAGFTLDGATSSKKLLTMQRNNLTNNLWFTAEYFTGAAVSVSTASDLNYKVGLFSTDDSDELSKFNASYFTLFSLDYNFASQLKLDNASVRIDYVYNDEHADANTRDFSHVLSLSSQWQQGNWGLRTDLSAGDGHFGQSDVGGLVLMPFYDFTEHLQAVVRYTYITSSDNNGVRLNRYESEIVSGRGDQYDEIYTGFNVFFYGHKFKWQTGLQYTSLDDDANDGGEYEGWGISTGLRLSW